AATGGPWGECPPASACGECLLLDFPPRHAGRSGAAEPRLAWELPSSCAAATASAPGLHADAAFALGAKNKKGRGLRRALDRSRLRAPVLLLDREVLALHHVAVQRDLDLVLAGREAIGLFD